MSATKWAVRGLLRELRSPSAQKATSNMYRQHVLETARRFRVTGEEHCRARDELTHLGAIYHTYLASRRRHQQLLEEYKGAGERSVSQTAGMVGFKLPHDPR